MRALGVGERLPGLPRNLTTWGLQRCGGLSLRGLGGPKDFLRLFESPGLEMLSKQKHSLLLAQRPKMLWMESCRTLYYKMVL